MSYFEMADLYFTIVNVDLGRGDLPYCVIQYQLVGLICMSASADFSVLINLLWDDNSPQNVAVPELLQLIFVLR